MSLDNGFHVKEVNEDGFSCGSLLWKFTSIDLNLELIPHNETLSSSQFFVMKKKTFPLCSVIHLVIKQKLIFVHSVGSINQSG